MSSTTAQYRIKVFSDGDIEVSKEQFSNSFLSSFDDCIVLHSCKLVFKELRDYGLVVTEEIKRQISNLKIGDTTNLK